MLLDIATLSVAQLHELNQVRTFVPRCLCVFIVMLRNAQNFLDNTISATTPLMAELIPLTALRAEYEGSESFTKQIDFLISKGYEGIRRSRGDGDCFYRCMCHCTALSALYQVS